MRIQIFDYFVIDLVAISACGFFAVAQPVSPNVPGLLRNSHEHTDHNLVHNIRRVRAELAWGEVLEFFLSTDS